MSAFVYILKCADGSYYTGLTRAALDVKVAQHNHGVFGGYTRSRRPVELIYAEEFQRVVDAIAAERRIKGWSRAKKEALAQGNWQELQRLAKSRST